MVQTRWILEAAFLPTLQVSALKFSGLTQYRQFWDNFRSGVELVSTSATSEVPGRHWWFIMIYLFILFNLFLFIHLCLISFPFTSLHFLMPICQFLRARVSCIFLGSAQRWSTLYSLACIYEFVGVSSWSPKTSCLGHRTQFRLPRVPSATCSGQFQRSPQLCTYQGFFLMLNRILSRRCAEKYICGTLWHQLYQLNVRCLAKTVPMSKQHPRWLCNCVRLCKQECL